MESQVLRAVQHARSRPKQEALSLEGALGKIAFHGSGRPRALLDVRRPVHVEEGKAAAAAGILGDKDRHEERRVLRGIENVYDVLLDLEEERRPGGSALEDDRRQELLERLWHELGVMEPIDQEYPSPKPTSHLLLMGRNTLHPFIAFLSYLKGKKAMPRVFLVITSDQRLTILTMIIAHLQLLDVISQAHYPPSHPTLPASTTESIETFLSSVIPPIVPLVETSHLGILIGLMGILLDRNSVAYISETKIGLAFLTLLLSRSQIILNGEGGGAVDEEEQKEWRVTFDKFFGEMEGHWSGIFPPPQAWGDDVYVWQFLASVAVGANMEQQHILVQECRYRSPLALLVGVSANWCRERVLDNVIASKGLPGEIAKSKIDNTNLFLRAMGLDAGMLS
jgi:DNA topoisomerase 2-associated protein PAT1